MISEPVIVSSDNNGTVPAIGKAEISNLPISREKTREELAAVKAQAAFRGYLVTPFFID